MSYDDNKHKQIEVVECNIEDNHVLVEKDNHILVEDKSNHILYAPIFLDTSLPRNGWIHGCIVCNANTSNTFFYKDKTYENVGYMVYCCRNCNEAKKNNTVIQKEYNDTIIDYVETYKDVIYEKIMSKINM